MHHPLAATLLQGNCASLEYENKLIHMHFFHMLCVTSKQGVTWESSVMFVTDTIMNVTFINQVFCYK